MLHDLLGVVLVGGKSLRMGEAKAHMLVDNIPQWQRSHDALKEVCKEVLYSTSKNLSQALPVASKFLIEDIFVEPFGPLGGMISAFKHNPDRAIFFLACDMPQFSKEAAVFLRGFRDPKKKATLFVKDGHIEPLCGIYEPAVFLELLHSYAKGLYCPRKIAEQLDIKRVLVPKADWLLNINHPHERVAKAIKTVTVHYYAMLAEQSMKPNELLSTTADNLLELYLELKSRYGFLMDENSLRFAKNNKMVSAVCKLTDQDEVVFIPPVCGG
jgi:molybdopterin-guanine dinucleotide biosynthesis protein A/molybdopterin converting factor small subunit